LMIKELLARGVKTHVLSSEQDVDQFIDQL
jgi:hypothetical protein